MNTASWFGTVSVMVAVFVIFLVSCSDQYSPPIDPQVNFEGVNIDVTIYFYDDRSAFQRQADKRGLEIVSGFADASWFVNLTNPACEIHMMRVRGVSDYERMTTLGHELLHCVYGLYHEPGVR